MHCYPNLSEHLHDYYPELSGESLISILLKSISGVLFVWNIVYFSSFFFVCVGFCTLDKTVTLSLSRVVSVGDELLSFSGKLFVASQTFSPATFFVLGAS